MELREEAGDWHVFADRFDALEHNIERVLRGKHDQIRLVLLYYGQGVHTVSRLPDHVDTAHLLEQEAQLIARELLIVHDNRAEVGAAVLWPVHAVIRSAMLVSGITTRAQVPSPGTLSSCS